MEFLFFEKELEALSGKIEKIKTQKSPDLEKLNALEKELNAKTKEIYSNLKPVEISAIARHPQRPLASDYINSFVADFQELAGDRRYGDDKAIISGIGKLGNESVAIIAQERGNDIQSRVYRNFGQAKPEGYRKAVRIMKMAEKFDMPVINLIDITGAYPGKESEERGIHEAIAKSIQTTLSIEVPVISVIIGEGGSGGAIAIGAADRVIMLENSIYSVISAEGASAILWKSRDEKETAAEALKFTSKDLKKLGIIDEIVSEGIGGAQRNPQKTIENLRKSLESNLKELNKISRSKIVKKRADKFLDMTI
ncbi:MAG: acetyl-CoA carboxylase carboxyltransferase subunit alpha [Alphaproteobacteria bacterium]|nr:acetyl-CoA carboxylase carboxyltransferase subunit alpha [Alphaproteobacteria bacterium]